MSDGMAPGRDAAWVSGPGPHAADGAYRSWAAPDPRRRLQLVLGGFWLPSSLYRPERISRNTARMPHAEGVGQDPGPGAEDTGLVDEATAPMWCMPQRRR